MYRIRLNMGLTGWSCGGESFRHWSTETTGSLACSGKGTLSHAQWKVSHDNDWATDGLLAEGRVPYKKKRMWSALKINKLFWAIHVPKKGANTWNPTHTSHMSDFCFCAVYYPPSRSSVCKSMCLIYDTMLVMGCPLSAKACWWWVVRCQRGAEDFHANTRFVYALVCSAQRHMNMSILWTCHLFGHNSLLASQCEVDHCLALGRFEAWIGVWLFDAWNQESDVQYGHFGVEIRELLSNVCLWLRHHMKGWVGCVHGQFDLDNNAQPGWGS